MDIETGNALIAEGDLKTAIDSAIKAIKERHKKVSSIKTPKKYIEQKNGFDYAKFAYMKKIADDEYPGWKWKIVGFKLVNVPSTGMLEAFIIHGRLIWYENGLWREGDMTAAHRIQYKRVPKIGKDGKVITDAITNKPVMVRGNELVDIGNDVKAANTDCMKKAFNIYLNIADDVYKAHIEDIELSKEQIDVILTLAGKLGREDEFQGLINSGTINGTNYKGTKAKLERLIKEKGIK